MSSKNLPPMIGRYQVIDRIGHGGMGLVYRGRDARIGGRFVAIKLLNVSDEDLRDRFLREAATAGSLKHPNIVTIYDYGEHEGLPFIVMEYVEGVTLSETIRSQLELSLARKLEIIGALASGLDYAHNKGVVHRDIKPANVMIDQDGVLKILDFGIAYVPDSSMTQAGTLMGTPNYMSPEQVEGRAIDRRSDIFSVGLVFYELLSYRQAFSGETIHHVLSGIVHGQPTPIGEVCPGLDPAIAAIVNRAIKKNPADRYQTLGEFIADLASVSKQSRKSGLTWRNSSATTVLTPPPSPPTPIGRRGADRSALSKRRAERIELFLPVAQQALEKGDFAAAVEACEEAALLDPEEPRVLAMMERARAGLDAQRIRDWLAEAHRCLEQRDLDQASHLVDQALALDPASADAQRAREAIERERLIVAALVRARQGLSSGQLETAIRAAGEILIQDPTHQEAHELTREALRLLDERRQREALDRAAQAAIEQQRAAFASGRTREAIEALEAFAPPHAHVSAALAEMRRELADVERRAAEEAERRQREAAEAERRREAREQWISRELNLARNSIDAQRFDEAIEVLRYLARVVPDVPELDRLLETARAGQAAVEAKARQAREIEEKLADADRARTRGDLAAARMLLDAVLELAPGHVDATTRRRDIDAELAARERAEAAEAEARAAVDAARRQFNAGQRAEAIAALESFSPAHDLVTRAHTDLSAKLAAMQRAEAADRAMAQAERTLANGDFSEALHALEQAEISSAGNQRAEAIRARARAGLEEQQRAEEHLRRALAVVADARARFAAGDVKGALKLLDRFSPAHAVTSEALSQLRAETAAREEQQRRAEEEERRRAEEERAARIDVVCEHARTDITQGRFSEALEQLRRLEQAEGRVPRVRALIEEAQAGEAAAEEQRRSEEHEQRARAAAADARQRFAAGDQKGSLRLLERFSPPHAIVSQTLSELRAEIAAREEQRRAEEDRRRREEEAARKLAAEARAAQAAQEAKARDAAHHQAVAQIEETLVEPAAVRTAPAAAPQVRPGRFNTLVLWSASVAAALLVAVGGVYLLRGTSGPASSSSGSGGTSAAEVARIVGESGARLRQNDLAGAAQPIAAALVRDPGNPELQHALQQVFETAADEVGTAKRAADAARASSRPEYASATAQLQSAMRSRASGRPQDAATAVAEYLAAEKLFNDAARSSGAPVDTTGILESSRRLLADNNLTGAVHEIVAGLRRDPENTDFKRALQQVLGVAEDRANAAKRAASGSERSNASEYGRASADLAAAVASRRSARVDDAESAARSYTAAADGFMEAVNKHALALLKQGNLVDAAHVAVDGLRADPAEPGLRKALQQTLDTAASHATAAKQSADNAAASRRPEYGAAASKIKSADDSRRADRLDRAEPAVQEYADAERLFREAARLASPPGTGPTPSKGNSGPGPIPTVDIGPILDGADREENQGNLVQAAHELTDGLRRAPNNAQLTSKLREILGRAQADATNAKRAADAAGASARTEYAQAASRLGSATNAGRADRPEDLESAIRGYVAAGELFKSAATGMEADVKARQAADRTAIGGVLDQYEAAYSRLDAEAVSRLDPSEPLKTLQSGFGEYKSAHLTLATRQINLQGDVATVACVQQTDVVPKRGANKPMHQDVRVTVTLHRTGNGWSIVNIK